METQKPLLKDEDGEEVDVHLYRSMIGSLMYLTSSRPDIMFAVCACARYQVNPKVSHLHAVKRIFRYLKGQPKLGLWYPKDSPFDLEAYTDSDYARASLDRKSTIGGCQFLGCRLISWQCKKQTVVANSTTEAEYVAALSCCGQVLWIQNQLLDYGYNFMHTKIFIDNNNLLTKAFDNGIGVNAGDSKLMLLGITYYCWLRLQLEDVEGVDCLPNATIFEQLTLMGTMASAIICLATNQKFNFSKFIFESMVKNLDNVGKFFMYPRFVQVFLNQQLEDMSTHKRLYIAPSHTKKIFGNMRRVGKGGLIRRLDAFGKAATTGFYLEAEQMDMCSGPRFQETMGDTIAQTRFKNVSKISTDPLLARARVESSGNEANLGEDASKQGRKSIDAIDEDDNITLVSTQNVNEEIMFDVSDLAGEEVFVAEQGVPDSKKDDVVSTAHVTTPVSAATITPEEITLAQALEELKIAKPKVKGIIFKDPEQGSDRLDEEAALRLQVELQAKVEEEERIEREKAEKSNVALTEEWDDIQAKIEADRLLAKRLQAREQEELTIEERAKLFQQLFEKRRKHFAAKRTEQKRNRPPTKAQQKNIMCTYLKNIEGKKLKRAGTELEQEVTKKQKVDDVQETAKVDEDKETAELQKLMEVVPDKEEVAIDAIPLATKPPSIIDWKIHKEGQTSYYQITRADGSSKMYLVFSQLLKSFDREDLETLWRLVKAKNGYTRPEEGYERVLCGDLKVMFEPHVEDAVWRNL
ncbi:hypothetical protein Tco_1549410 [Tanacetum coccineum]